MAIKNTAATTQTATISCIAEKSTPTQRQVQLAAGGWALVQPCGGSSSSAVGLIGDVLASPSPDAADLGAFGISVNGSGKPGSLAAFGFSWRATGKRATLSSQNFLDAGSFRSANTVFTGVPVGAANYLPGEVFTPQVAVTNFGARPANVTVLFSRTGGSGPEASTIARASVPAMRSQTIALPPLNGDPELRNSFIVQSDAPPGALVASQASVGSSGFGLVEQIGKDQQMTANGGGHPWDLTDGRDAVLLLFNHSQVAKYFNVKISSGQVLWQQAWQLAPMETRAVSIRELISGQVRDQDGSVLPQTLEQGEVGWFTPNPAEGKGRLMQIDPASQTVAGITRVARNFSCGYYYILCGAYLYVDSMSFADGTASSPDYLGQIIPEICTNGGNGGCAGQSSSHSGLGYTYSWVSNTPTIATVYGSTTSSTATFWGQGPGTGSAIGYVASEGCQFGGAGSTNVTQATVTAANVATDTITVVLAGPSGSSGNLVVNLVGSPTNYQIVSKIEGPGTYDFTFSRPSLPVSDFSSVAATWAVSGAQATGSMNVAFYALGSTRFSTYNVPYESQCSGASATSYIFTNWSGSVCTYKTATLNSEFMGQASLNGTGVSASNGTLKAAAALNYCELPPGGTQGNSGNTFYAVSSITGSCNVSLSGGTSLATNPSPNPGNTWHCGDQVLLVTSNDTVNSTKTVQDACPGCSTPGHIDTFSSSQACKARSLNDYGTFTAIRLR